ncbi:MAG TPA: hypothetical protein VIS99_09725 [Terrimicrobiaceae bacterium]
MNNTPGSYLELRLDGAIPLYREILKLQPYALLSLNLGYNTNAYYGSNNFQFGLRAIWQINPVISIFGGINYSVAMTALKDIDADARQLEGAPLGQRLGEFNGLARELEVRACVVVAQEIDDLQLVHGQQKLFESREQLAAGEARREPSQANGVNAAQRQAKRFELRLRDDKLLRVWEVLCARNVELSAGGARGEIIRRKTILPFSGLLDAPRAKA